MNYIFAYIFIGLYHKRRLSPCRKKSKSADDDDGCQTGVGRTRSRAGVGWEQAGSRPGVSKSREEARVEPEH